MYKRQVYNRNKKHQEPTKNSPHFIHTHKLKKTVLLTHKRCYQQEPVNIA